MHRKQAGITFIGWMFLLIPLAVVGYAAIRLVPIYLNYTRVARSMEQVADEAKADLAGTINPAMVRNSLDKRLEIEGIEFPTLDQFGVHREGKGWVIEINYEEAVPFIANVSLLVSFRKTVPFGAPEE